MSESVEAGEPAPSDAVEVELYGLPRQRAGIDRCRVPAGTLEQVLTALARAWPGLVPDIVKDGRATRHVLVALDGRAMIESPAEVIARGRTLVLLSAQAGG
jgi:hypothetical protein